MVALTQAAGHLLQTIGFRDWSWRAPATGRTQHSRTPFIRMQLFCIDLFRAQPFHEHFFDIHIFHTRLFHRQLLNAKKLFLHTHPFHMQHFRAQLFYTHLRQLLHATLSHTTLSHIAHFRIQLFKTIDPPASPLSFLPSPYRFRLEEVDLWGYPVLEFLHPGTARSHGNTTRNGGITIKIRDLSDLT